MPGTCGELVQGMLDGRHFLVSCPIDLYSRVTVELREEPGLEAPADAPKAAAALGAALRFFGAPDQGARLTIDSALPRSKGMGSSTADVAGAIYATAAALGCEIAPAEVARLCLGIEPTDGSLFPHIALFDHRHGSLYEELGPAPPMGVVVLDLGGEVDTLAYNAVDRTSLLRRLSARAEQALALVREGIHKDDLERIGLGATLSARAHQEVLPKPPLESIIAAARRLGAVGVNAGHSGTVVGVLFPPGGATESTGAALREAVPEAARAMCVRLVDGGSRVLTRTM
jgi:L-threonine kinase